MHFKEGRYMIIYKNIIEKLKDAGYSSYKVRETGVLSEGTMQAFRTNRPVNLKTIDAVCQLLRCRIEDIVEVVIDHE